MKNTTIQTQMDLHGRVAIITGGAGYLGRTMAHTLAEAGANIVIVDINMDKIAAVCSDFQEKWQSKTLGIAVDLENKEERCKIVPQVIDKFGRLDILINNAAFVGTSNLTGWGVPFEQQETETWRRALEVNLTAVFDLTQTAAPYLRKSGKGNIINVATRQEAHNGSKILHPVVHLHVFNSQGYCLSHKILMSHMQNTFFKY